MRNQFEYYYGIEAERKFMNISHLLLYNYCHKKMIRDGCRWTDVHSFSNADYWWNHSIVLSDS